MITVEDVVKRLKRHRPHSVLGVLNYCELPLEYLDEGAYRFAYRVVGTGLVIKVPIGQHQDSIDLEHSRREIAAYRKLLKPKYSDIWSYLPDFYYTNRNTGIILTDEYTPFPYSKIGQYEDQIRELEGFMLDLGYGDPDIGFDKLDNYGLDAEGNLKLLDLGCFSKERFC